MACCGDEDVAVPENVVGVWATSAVSVGDGVALEQDSAAWRESRDGINGEEGVAVKKDAEEKECEA